MGRNVGRTIATLLAYALGFPDAWEDHPWGETVAKVDKKVFVFFGGDDGTSSPTLTVKLDESHGQALASTGIEPSGYGLGRSGWVTVGIRRTTVPNAVLRDWIEESYRLVAPKRSVEALDRV